MIFDRSVFADLRSADPDTGAKAVFAIHRDRIVNVEVKDAGAFEDIDTPEDYERIRGLGLEVLSPSDLKPQVPSPKPQAVQTG